MIVKKISEYIVFAEGKYCQDTIVIGNSSKELELLKILLNNLIKHMS